MSRLLILLVAALLLAACAPTQAVPPAPTTPAVSTPAAPPTVEVVPTVPGTPEPLPSTPPTETETPAPADTPAPGGASLALPGAGHDLLFLDRGRLMYWRHDKEELSVLAGPQNVPPAPTPGGVFVPEPTTPESVVLYSVAETRVVVYAQLKAEGEFELMRLDLSSGASEKLLDITAPRLIGLVLSPDGHWLAYVPADSAEEHLPPSGTVYLLDMTAAGAEPQEVAPCAMVNDPNFTVGCGAPIWAPDSSRIAWGDGAGLWIAKPGGEAGMIVASGPGTPGSGTTQGVHVPRAFSPDAAYLLELIGYYEGSAQAVLRIGDAQEELIPDADEYLEASARAVWLDNSRLLVVRHGSASPEVQAPVIEILRAADQGTTILTSEARYEIAEGGNSYPVAVTRLADGRIVFPLLGSQLEAPGPDALYMADPDAQEVHKVVDLPSHVQGEYHDFVHETAFAPDGAVIMRYAQGLLYVPIDGSPAVDLRPQLGYGVERFTWVS